MTDVVLALNAGSSSIKAAAYTVDGDRVWKGAVDGIGHAGERAVQPADGGRSDVADDADMVRQYRDHTCGLIDRMHAHTPALDVVAVGHRVVHGGRNFSAPELLTDAVRETLRKLSPLAPSHQPYSLAGIDAVTAIWPQIPQIACFDTAFHRSQSRIAQLFALPRRFADDGVLRYGFHGLSYEYIASVLPHYAGARADGRVIVAHLGHGASLCGMRERRSISTSMGFTALDGLMMGERCGALDPGVVLYLLRDCGMSVAEVDTLLTHQSGLLGVSGISTDMRHLLASDDPHAREAVDLFVYRAVAAIGALIAELGGLDVLVFTAGIGEHAPQIRERIVRALEWLPARIDPATNARGTARIHAAASSVDIFTIPTDEQYVIACHARSLVRATR